MACFCSAYELPCHTENSRFQSQSRIPYDVPLSVDTHVQYNLDKSRFPGLESGYTERTLMIADPRLTPASSEVLLSSSPSLGELMLGHSQHYTASQESSSCSTQQTDSSPEYVDRDLDTNYIVSLIGRLIFPARFLIVKIAIFFILNKFLSALKVIITAILCAVLTLLEFQ